MAIREDIVASAAQFLLDPSVANSSVENRVNFLRTKNLTQEEIDAALSRVGVQRPAGPVATATGSPVPAAQPQYYQQAYPPQYAAWQPPPPVPKRDWRDWFIMATVVSGVGYGVYALTKRYVYPLIAPPTPERLEQDKKSIEEQFDKAFSLVEQLAKDTEELKTAEKERTEKLDSALSDFESAINDLKSANRRRDDEAQRIRDDIYNLKDAIPKAMDTQKDLTDQRLREINAELTSLKTLITQRMAPPSSPAPAAVNGLRPASSAGGPGSPSFAKASPTTSEKPADKASESESAKASTPTTANKGFTLGGTGAKASIPAWQMAMANKPSSAAGSTTSGVEAGSSSQQGASGSA